MATESRTVIVVYSHIVGLAVIRALGRRGIPVVVLHYLPVEMGYVSKYVRHHVRITSPHVDEAAFVADILALGDRFAGSLIVPTDDYTVVALSRNRTRLEPRYRVAVEDWDIVRRVIRKQHTYELAEEVGVPYPKTAVCETPDDIDARIGEFRFPCLLKPCEGHRFYDIFRKKVLVVRDPSEVRARYRDLRDLGIPVMMQEIIPGEACEGVNYNSYVADGELLAEFTAEKVRVDPPFFGSPRVIVSKRIPEILEPGRKLIKALGYTGFSCMEFKRDVRDGVYKLMEVNARHNLSGALAVACGVDFPWIMYRDLVEGRRETASGFREGVFWIDLTKDLMRFLVSRSAEGYSVAQYLVPYRRKHVFAIWDAGDPLPFIKRCADIVRKGATGRGHAHDS